MRLLCLFGAALQLAVALNAEARERSSVSRAVFAAGRLWLLDDLGGLSSLDEAGRVRREKVERVADICRDGEIVLAMTCAQKPCATWTMRERTQTGWRAAAQIPTNGEELVALRCEAEEALIVTSKRLIRLEDGHEDVVQLDNEVSRSLVAAVFADSKQVLLGLNKGEWGGGILRIDRTSGQVTPVQSVASKWICDGPLNPKCDPVHAIVASPWKPGCVVAAIGLEHFSPHGRIVEICDNEVRSVFADGTATTSKFPVFRRVGRYRVSFESPRFVFALTDISQHMAISDETPLLVPR